MNITKLKKENPYLRSKISELKKEYSDDQKELLKQIDTQDLSLDLLHTTLEISGAILELEKLMPNQSLRDRLCEMVKDHYRSFNEEPDVLVFGSTIASEILKFDFRSTGGDVLALQVPQRILGIECQFPLDRDSADVAEARSE